MRLSTGRLHDLFPFMISFRVAPPGRLSGSRTLAILLPSWARLTLAFVLEHDFHRKLDLAADVGLSRDAPEAGGVHRSTGAVEHRVIQQVVHRRSELELGALHDP